MVLFQSESQLVELIEKHDELVRQCASGQIDFAKFCDEYGDFYEAYALDGHESDEEEKAILVKNELRLKPHQIIAHSILNRLYIDGDVDKDAYRKAGRIDDSEAKILLMRLVADTWPTEKRS